MLVLTHDTLRNPAILETTVVPRKFFGRVMPRMRQARLGQRLRLIVEVQFLRYMIALVPFCIPMLVWPQSAAPISQAPLAMVILIAISEKYVLRLSDRERLKLMSEDEAGAVIDKFRFRAAAVLREIAAGRDLQGGTLALVVEQSDMARVAPLSLVTVQAEQPKPHVLSLTPEEHMQVRTLFDSDFSERGLHRASLRLNRFLHVASIETRAVSAHARLAARLNQRKEKVET